MNRQCYICRVYIHSADLCDVCANLSLVQQRYFSDRFAAVSDEAFNTGVKLSKKGWHEQHIELYVNGVQIYNSEDSSNE